MHTCVLIIRPAGRGQRQSTCRLVRRCYGDVRRSVEVQGARLSAPMTSRDPNGKRRLWTVDREPQLVQYGVWSYTWPCDYVFELSVSVNDCLLVVAETAARAGSWELGEPAPTPGTRQCRKKGATSPSSRPPRSAPVTTDLSLASPDTSLLGNLQATTWILETKS